MKTSRLEKAYIAVLVIILAGIVLHAPISVGLGKLWPDYMLWIKAWKEILMVVMVPLAAIIVSRRHMWHTFFNDWIVRLIIIFAAIHLLTIPLFFDNITSTLAGLAIDLRYILFFTLVYVAIRLFPQYRTLFVKVGVAGAVVVVGFATLQLFLPPDFLKIIGYGHDTIEPYLTVDKNSDYIRVNSTLRGPNPLGAYVSIVLALLTAAIVRGKLEWRSKKTITLAICSVIALWISYSRSALVAAIVAVAIVVVAVAGRSLSRRHWIAVGLATLAVAGMLVIGRGATVVSNVLFHENPADTSSVNSNEGHIGSLVSGLQQVSQQPLGGGIGSAGSASLFGNSPFVIENQYLLIAHEVGWLGIEIFAVLFIFILLLLWRRRQDWLALGVFASGIGLALIGLLLPVWTDDTVSIIWWGLAAIALASGKYEYKKTK